MDSYGQNASIILKVKNYKISLFFAFTPRKAVKDSINALYCQFKYNRIFFNYILYLI